MRPPPGIRFPHWSYKTRHCQSDKNRLFDSSVDGSRDLLIHFDVSPAWCCAKIIHAEICLLFQRWSVKWPKCGRTRSFLTGFQVGGISLKDRSAGGWRSGLQRSEMWWRRGHVSFRACRPALQHLPCQGRVGEEWRTRPKRWSREQRANARRHTAAQASGEHAATVPGAKKKARRLAPGSCHFDRC